MLQQLDDGVEVHLRAEELAPLAAKAEGIGNRLVASIILTAFIRGIGELITADRRHLQNWLNTLSATGIGVLSAMGGFLAWTSRPGRRIRRQ